MTKKTNKDTSIIQIPESIHNIQLLLKEINQWKWKQDCCWLLSSLFKLAKQLAHSLHLHTTVSLQVITLFGLCEAHKFLG